MHEALVTSGNRITVPRFVREAMGMKAGDIIGFIPAGRGFRLCVMGSKNSKPTAQRAAAPKAR